MKGEEGEKKSVEDDVGREESNVGKPERLDQGGVDDPEGEVDQPRQCNKEQFKQLSKTDYTTISTEQHEFQSQNGCRS